MHYNFCDLVIIIAIVWTAIAVGVGVVIGRSITMADKRAAITDRPAGDFGMESQYDDQSRLLPEVKVDK